MNTDDEKFALLAAAVAAGRSVKDASVELSILRTTSYRWSASPAFKTKVAEIRAECLSQAVGRISSAAVQAIEVLTELMIDGEQKAADRIAACKALLSSLTALSSLGELRSRLEVIERELSHVSE
jgi:hypothetical protein